MSQYDDKFAFDDNGVHLPLNCKCKWSGPPNLDAIFSSEEVEKIKEYQEFYAKKLAEYQTHFVNSMLNPLIAGTSSRVMRSSKVERKLRETMGDEYIAELTHDQMVFLQLMLQQP